MKAKKKKKKLNEKFKDLTKEDKESIAKEFGVTPGHINNIIGGSRKNISILEALVKLAFKAKERKEKLEEDLEKLS